jgi:hypothetical protein
LGYSLGDATDLMASVLPVFPWYNTLKRKRKFQITTKHTKQPQNELNGLKIYQHIPLQNLPKLIGIFCLKIYHLATLDGGMFIKTPRGGGGGAQAQEEAKTNGVLIKMTGSHLEEKFTSKFTKNA